MPMTVWIALLAALATRDPARDEFSDQLARLSSPRSAERAAAERWLGAHLPRERYPELAEAALAGDAEVRARLVRVLSSDERHLALALLLFAEKEPALSALGREAVRAGVARAEPRLAEPPLRDELLQRTLRTAASSGAARILRLDAQLSLEEMVAELELAGELPVGVTVDPGVATRTIRRSEDSLAAPWNELFLRLSRSMGVTLESHGLRPLGEDPEGGFLHLTNGPARTGIELIGEWLTTVASPLDEAARARAARNLAACGFAPAVEWLDQLVRATGDRAAREGLLTAAARGRVAPALLAPGVLEELLAEAVQEAGGRSARILSALARSGCTTADGGALAPRILAGFEGASPRAQWAGLSWLEHNACAAPEAAAQARALLAAPSTPPLLRLQAMHALVALERGAGPRVEVAGLSELFRQALDEVELEHLGRALRVLGLEPPPPETVAGDARALAGLLQAWLWNGAPERVAACLAALLAQPGAEAGGRGREVADALRPWLFRGDAELLRGALRRAGERVPERAGELERVQLLLAEVPAVLARGGRVLSGPGMDLDLVAALAGYPEPIAAEVAAREALLAALGATVRPQGRAADVAPLLDALERAAQGLYAAGRDAQGDDLVQRVRRAGNFARRLERQLWPSAPAAQVRDVGRELGRFAIPF